MSSSEVIFHENSRHVRDASLGYLLDELKAFVSGEANISGHDLTWLVDARREWEEIWRTMPPGLKDINLSPVLSDSCHKCSFKVVLNELIESCKFCDVRKDLEKIGALLK